MWRWWLGYFVILIAAADDETSCWIDDNSLLQHPATGFNDADRRIVTYDGL